MEAGLMKRILLSGSWIFYKIYNIYFAPNCPGQIVAPNCPRRIVLHRIVRELKKVVSKIRKRRQLQLRPSDPLTL